ncbi:MAG: hypothetical protein JKY56_07740 [Kofleriaceae bacterium]|nr:hypothetical protein [Kofleriaceae bacterium]
MKKESSYPWLFSANVDLGVFLGSALLSVLLLAVGASLGVLQSDSPEWIWVPAVLLIDVAHVWSTVFRVYFDREERRRRPWVYWGAPAVGYAAGVCIYSFGAMWFWTVAAYLAVYHFVRQQYGWVVLYRRRGEESGQLDRWVDTATIYAATVYPLIYWHAHLPRRYWWFVPKDFIVHFPLWVDTILAPMYWAILAAYTCRALYRWFVLHVRNPGKDVVVVTTALCWYLGIVYFNSDYAFTVTNVVIHGIPYFALIYFYGRRRALSGKPGAIRLLLGGPLVFIAVLVCFAYGEELLWDQLIWHERSWLFGGASDLALGLETLLVPLLALPQITHYLLDGFIWRGDKNRPYMSG